VARRAEVRGIDEERRELSEEMGEERMLECLRKGDTVHGDGTSYHISANIERACLDARYSSSIEAAQWVS